MNLKLIIVSILILTSYLSKAQNCIPVAIVFTTQAQVDAFPTDYPGCAIIEGNVGITGNDITNIDSLIQITKINGSLQILNADGLNNLDGFENLTHILGSLILNNVAVNNINGLDNLNFIGASLKIERCNQLNEIDGLNNIDSLNGDLIISICYSLVNLSGLSNLNFIDGSLNISNLNLSSFSGFSSLNSVGSSFNITSPGPSLNLVGFNNLTYVGEGMNFVGNFIGLSGFSNLTTINGGLVIRFNNSITLLDGFNSLTTIEKSLEIWRNSLLTQITGFNNLSNVQNLYIYDNIFLSNIDGFDHSITMSTFGIFDNPFLSNCSVESICNKLWQNNGSINITNNGTNCNSIPLVLQSCGTAPDGDGDGVNDFVDNCPTISNPLQTDCNGNQIGDVCETGDIDTDGIDNIIDNCPCQYNPNQADANNNDIGDKCDTESDTDGDTWNDPWDNCPLNANTNQSDWDNNGKGDACQDSDGDGIMDDVDNCRDIANNDQADCDSDGIGDACTSFTLDITAQACFYYTWDTGNDSTYYESGVYTFDTTYANGCSYSKTLQLTITNSGSQYSSEVTACNQYAWEINDSTYTQSGTYVHYINDCYKATLYLTIDSVGTNTHQYEEHCVSFTWINGMTYTESGEYYILDSLNNTCPDTLTLHLYINEGTEDDNGGPDDDNDGWINGCDNCPTVANTNQLDCNNNGVGDACEPVDTDCDGIADSVDNCPNHPNKFQTDLNNNGLGDACEDFPKMGFNTSNPLTEFHLSNGTLYIDNPEKGIILKNYQGQCFILKMDGLSLTATLIPCP